jgi:hypothetical protein
MFLFNFIVFLFTLILLSMISKVFGKISVSLRLFKILEISELAIAKDEKVYIAVA